MLYNTSELYEQYTIVCRVRRSSYAVHPRITNMIREPHIYKMFLSVRMYDKKT